ncbi:hypothetical protein B0A55_04355 [Friedmanniomyces simplex]|uniref:F-box domain-containing protein n=1 Tax=Friedmanniomyces simplex TaxID=329884 RepID=A0A4U0XSW2_9PEZI|nr:hypothetical protein B0A55_04355 [Friedmanniomyces simplex]
MASRANPAHFCFFDLAVELRNKIYRYATTETQTTTIHGVLSKGCRVQLLQVSRRFKDEYEAEVYRYARLTRHNERHGEGRDLRGVGADNSTTTLRFLQHLTFRVTLYFGTLEDAQGSLPALLSMLPALRTLHVQLELDLEDVRMMIDYDDVDRIEAVRRVDVAALRNLFAPQFSVTGLISAGRHVAVSQESLLNGRLFEAILAGEDRRTVRWLFTEGHNCIRYRATLSSGPYAFLGIGLEFIEASGEVDLEEAAREHLEYRRQR